ASSFCSLLAAMSSCPGCAAGARLLPSKKLPAIFRHWMQALPNNALAPAVGFLAAAIRLSTPLLLAAGGELVAERAGVLNLGVEGMMLNGALFGFLGAYFSGSLVVGWLSGMGAGGLLALLFAIFAISFRAHQVIVALG